MEIKCIPTKELFTNYTNGYRVVSCMPIGHYIDLVLNRYNNFTLSGSNISNLKVGEQATLNIELDPKSKYEGSYILTGYTGVKVEAGKIVVDRRFEHEILSRLMEESQVGYILKAYPDFVQMVLNGEEDKISYKNIFNVGPKRLPEYINKVKEDGDNILFYPVAMEAGISSTEDIKEIRKIFANPDAFKQELDVNPYRVYLDLLHFPFEKSDELVLKKHPELRDSQVRCEYGCLAILHENESLGDTRLEANIMAHEARKIIPEAYHYMVQAVTESKLIHYDPVTKYASIEATYQDELTIAKAIKSRLGEKVPWFEPMDWEDYKVVDGFECTEEQTKILRIVAEGGRCAILTGSGGSGKTSSIKALIRMLEANHHDYTLLAPTGVAAKRMRESTGRPASTIHMFLACEGAMAGEYVIVDECSMVGVNLMASLMHKIGDEPNLIFVCDEAQLASISCGNIVQDLLDSNVVPRANLTKIFRYGIGGVATIATDARFGTMDNLHNRYDDFTFVPIGSDPIGQVLEQYDKLLEKGYAKDDILVLSPFNKGNKGTYEINRAIQSRYNEHDYCEASYERKGLGTVQFKVGDRILNTHNNYHMPSVEFEEDGTEVIGEIQVMNGDLGICRECRRGEKGPILVVEFDNGLASVSGADLANLLLGYSVSIHKVQGAQSKAIIVVIDQEHMNLLSRNLEYVSFSRAQKEMVIIADEDVLKDGLDKEENKERDTYLCEMLKEE